MVFSHTVILDIFEENLLDGSNNYVVETLFKGYFYISANTNHSSTGFIVVVKARGPISKRVFQENKALQVFRKNEHF